MRVIFSTYIGEKMGAEEARRFAGEFSSHTASVITFAPHESC
jgi:hypothetical protein